MGEPFFAERAGASESNALPRHFFREPCSAVSVEQGGAKSCEAMADNYYFSKRRTFTIAAAQTDLFELA